MKHKLLFIASGLLACGGLVASAHASHGKWSRMPELKEVAPQESAVFPLRERRDPMMLASEKPEGKAVFEESHSSLALRMVESPRYRQAKTAETLIGEIYGVVNNFDGQTQTEMSYAESFWGKMDFSDYSITPLFKGINFCNTLDQANQTGAVRDGILYIPEGIRSSIRDFEVIWKRFDLNEGRWLEALRCSDDASLWMMSMCYDPVTDAFYGMSGLEESGSYRYGRIVRVDLDPVTGQPKATVLVDNPSTAQAYSGFFYDPSEERILVFTDDGKISEFNRKTGSLITILELSCDDYNDDKLVFSGFDNRGTAHLVYSPRDKKVLMSVADPSSGLRTYFYWFDLEEGIIFPAGEIKDGNYITTLYTPDTFAEPEAAGQVKVEKINLNGSDLTGSIDFLLPDTRYDGIKLTGELTLVVEADGKEIFTKKAEAGTKVSVPFTLEEGLHKLSARADMPNLKGPDNSFKLYTGNDTPRRPSDVKVEGTTVSWTSPGETGFNNGYVDSSDLTYDVFFDDEKVNTAPVKGTSFTFENPSEMKRVAITVTATSHSKTSLPSEVVDYVVGEAMSLPYAATPEKNQAELFNTVDGNHDGSTFKYEAETKEMVHEYENYQSSDDWLILPAIYLADATRMHKFSLSFRTATPYYGTENIELCIGTSPETGSMRKLISYVQLPHSETRATLETNFNVEAPGTYYLAVHAKTSGAGAGSRVSNLLVKALDGSTQAPGLPEEVKVIPAEKGKLTATIRVRIPSKDASGNILADKDITVKVANFNGKSEHTSEGKGRPGETIDVSCGATQGFNSFIITATNEYGEGASTVAREYIGVDVPKIVENLRHVTSEDNMSMILSWDPVTEGVNGGYIDPDNLEYQIWYNPQGVTWNRVGDPVKETSVLFNTAFDDLYRYRVSIFAQNSAGFMKAETVDHVNEEILGRPIEFPFQERFGTSGNNYRWYYDRRTAGMENSSIRQVLNDELKILGIGNPMCEDGSGRLVCNQFYGEACKAELYVPKFSTVNQIVPTFRMRYWCHSNAPTFKIVASKFGQEDPKEIYSWTPSLNKNFTWEDVIFELPEEYRDQKWVQLRIRFDIGRASNAFGVIDGIDIYSMVSHDMKASSIKSEALTHIGNDCTFEVTFTNAGQERKRLPLYGEVIVDGQKADSQTKTMRGNLNSLGSYTDRFVFHAKPEYLNAKEVKVRFYTDDPEDEIPSNNSIETVWEILPSVEPIVTDLKGELGNSGTAELSWSEPHHAFGSFENFEYLEPFDYSENLGQWINLNRDKLQNFVVSGLEDRWPDCEVKKGWQVINDTRLGTEGDASLGAHSGHQFLIAMAGYNDQVESGSPEQVSDWLISPEVVGGTRVKFWINILDPTYRETLHIYYSTTDNKPESFIKLCNRSMEASTGWEQTYFDLPANAKYFAMEYVGWNTFGVCIDDLEFTPAKPDYWTVESYDVYRLKADSGTDYVKLQNIKTPSFTDSFDGKDTYYYVKCHASINNYTVEGPMSNVICFGPSGVAEVELLEGVAGGYGEISFTGLSGTEARVFSTDGKLQHIVRINEDYCSSPVEAGVYIVMTGDKAAKVVVR